MNIDAIVDLIGNQITKNVQTNPRKARKILRTAFRLDYFYKKILPPGNLAKSKCYLKMICEKNIITALSHPEKSAMVSLFVPCEPLTAMGIHAFSVESLSSYISGTHSHPVFLEKAEKDGLPETLCSYHKIFLGAAAYDVMPKPRFIIHTNVACDANQITFRKLENYFNIPHFKLDVPYRKSEEAVAYVADELRTMVKFIENCENRKMDQNKLLETIHRSAATVTSYQNYIDLNRTHYLRGDLTAELQMTFISHMMLGTPEAEIFAERSVEEIKETPPNNGIKLLWLHTIPFWQKPVQSLLNTNDSVHISLCDMGYESLIPVDTEKPYESMARRLVYSPFNGTIESRIEKALEIAERIQADGVIYFCHWGCKATLGGASLVKTKMEAAGYPVLLLDGDGCDSRNAGDGQAATRLEAFIEMLKGTK
ncbi:MAG: 2-hydroxyacyl-CoA dehydratase family protein [Treponema sp.]|jgi:benzoyl-CoA reductase/2-hydroxyglutaryl-CoA dehydratase subunit BcrC/BadD/HgdB|nr:2-hydroxyacyl-CoA dehydratase family protein [Treponema sp.]